MLWLFKFSFLISWIAQQFPHSRTRAMKWRQQNQSRNMLCNVYEARLCCNSVAGSNWQLHCKKLKNFYFCNQWTNAFLQLISTVLKGPCKRCVFETWKERLCWNNSFVVKFRGKMLLITSSTYRCSRIDKSVKIEQILFLNWIASSENFILLHFISLQQTFGT